MATLLILCLIATFHVGFTASTTNDSESPSSSVVDCPVCFCQWSGYSWQPVAAACGECECSEQMCSVYLVPPLAGAPLLCPWYGCPSGVPGPPPLFPPADGPTTTTTTGPPSDCPVCNCKWTSSKWLPEVVTHGRCECNVEMCSAHLQPPNAGQPVQCPWYGCPSGAPGPSGPT